jgi:hypothetical protein
MVREIADRTRAAISSLVAGNRYHSSALSSMARRRVVSSRDPMITGIPRWRARSTAPRIAVGLSVVIRTARTSGS